MARLSALKEKQTEEGRDARKLLINRKNGPEPRTDPRGTPQWTTIKATLAILRNLASVNVTKKRVSSSNGA